MNRLSSLRPAVALAVASLLAVASTGVTEAQSAAGYLWLQTFSANAAATNGQVNLSGQFTNDCTNPIPTGSILRIYFDQGTLLDITIRVAHGQVQQFGATVPVPAVSAPRNNVTAYRFAILVPAGPEMKTSPCLVTPALGTPIEP